MAKLVVAEHRKKRKVVKKIYQPSQVTFECEVCSKRTRKVHSELPGGEFVCSNECYNDWLEKSFVAATAASTA